MNPCQTHVDQFYTFSKANNMEMPGFKFLHDHGRIMEPRRDIIDNYGQRGLCYMNSFQRIDCDMRYVEGFAMKRHLIPLSHAWLSLDNTAVDPTWSDGDYYFGVPFDNDFVMEFAYKTGQYGILESLYLLKMDKDELYEYLVSGIAK